MLTARDGLPDRLRGLDGGADDYVIKPFELSELISRVGAVLRRRGRIPATVQLGDLLVDRGAGVAARAGTRLDLTATEMRLLDFLLDQRGRTVSAQPDPHRGLGLRLLRRQPASTSTSAVSARKLEAHGPRILHTARGIGYRLQAPRHVTTAEPTATPSLRRRVIVGALALLAVLLVLLGVTIDLLIGAQARRDLHDRVMASAARADALAIAAGTPPAQLAAEINGGGIRALLITADGGDLR